MTIYYVGDQQFFKASSAKKYMRETGLTGSKVKVYSNGDWIPMGEITLKGSNKSFIANSPRNMKKSNY